MFVVFTINFIIFCLLILIILIIQYYVSKKLFVSVFQNGPEMAKIHRKAQLENRKLKSTVHFHN